MERGSNKKNPLVDDEMKQETESLVRSNKEGHAEGHLQKEEPGDAEDDDFPEPAPPGHRIAGTGSSARPGEETGGRTDIEHGDDGATA